MKLQKHRGQLGIAVLVAFASLAVLLRSTPSSAERGPRRFRAARERSSQPRAEPPPRAPLLAIPRPGGIWDRGTKVPAADFVVEDPDWRWPNPNGSNPAPNTPVTITYSIAGLEDLSGLTCAEHRAAIEEALSRWAAHAPLHFVEVTDAGVCPSANDPVYNPAGAPQIRFGSHDFDGPSGTLAHTFFPFSAIDGIAGDVHFDCGETWSLSPGSGVIDFLEVALHEIGHALGLGHQPTPPGGVDAIMNPVYGERFNGLGTSALLQDDIDGIQAIYGTDAGSVTPLTGGGCGNCDACGAGGGGGGGGGSCALVELLQDRGQDEFFDLLGSDSESRDTSDPKQNGLDTLRIFRDLAIRQSPEGRELAELYYKHGPEMMRLFAKRPEIAAETLSVLRSAYPFVASAGGGDARLVRLDAVTYVRGLELVDRYGDHASPEFRKAIVKLRRFLSEREATVGSMVVLDLTDRSTTSK